MLKKILGMLVLVLSGSAMAAQPPLQVRMSNAIISNAESNYGNELVNIWVEYNSVVDDPVHSELFLPPCATANCYYGFVWSFERESGSVWVNFLRNTMDANGSALPSEDFYSPAIKYGPNDRLTYAEANKRLIEQLKSPSGVLRTTLFSPKEDRTKRMRVCVGTIPRTVSGTRDSSLYNIIVEVGGCSDHDLPLPPVTCEIQGSSTLNIQHSTLTSNQLNDANTPKSASGSFGLSCSDNILVKLSLSPTSIQLTDGLVSNITLKQDGKTVGLEDNIIVKKGNISRLEVTSTLSATGKITPNAYSGSAILMLSIY